MRYRRIDVRLWLDDKFRLLSPLQPCGQALFIYLLTNPNTTVIPGLYRAGAAAMAEELGWETPSLLKALNELITQGLIKTDLSARVIFIPNAIKYNKPQSPNVITSWTMHWDEIPECELKAFAYGLLRDFTYILGEAFAKAFNKAIKNPFNKTIVNQEQDKEQDQENTPSKTDAKCSTSLTIPKCPHDEIIAIYHEILPSLPQVKIWNETRRRHLQQRWRENVKHQDIQHWRDFFKYVNESPFLTGKTEGKDGKPSFIADLEWLIKPNNFAKIIEGKDHGGRS